MHINDFSNNDIRQGNVGPPQPGKEKVSSRTNMERSMLSITYRDRKTHVWVRENANTLLNKSEDGSEPGQAPS